MFRWMLTRLLRPFGGTEAVPLPDEGVVVGGLGPLSVIGGEPPLAVVGGMAPRSVIGGRPPEGIV